MALTEIEVRKAKPGLKPVRDESGKKTVEPTNGPYKLADEKGLYLLVSDTGRYWRFNYRYQGKQKTLALGVYPDTSLADAREKHAEARKFLAKDIDPAGVKKAQKSASAELNANSFEVVAREWYQKKSATWAPSNAVKVIARLENDIFPWLGKAPIASITAPKLLEVLRRIEARGAIETAHRARSECGQIFRYAIATGRVERDVAADLSGALTPVVHRHFAALTDPKAIGELLRAIDGYRGTFPVKCALQLAPLVFLRPGELRQAEWNDFDLDAATWTVPASIRKQSMAAKRDPKNTHIVPLSRQAVAILNELHPLTGHGRLLFPGLRDHDRPMSENTVNAALQRLGFDTQNDITGHGFRAMARTVLDEVLEVPPHIVEQQLAHAVKDPLGRAYNRTAHMPQRRELMQRWADYLDEIKQGGVLLAFPQAAA